MGKNEEANPKGSDLAGRLRIFSKVRDGVTFPRQPCGL